MSIFKKKRPETIIQSLPPKVGEKKVSVFDVRLQAYHEISLEEYYARLRALGLSDEEAKVKVEKARG
jgi:hypothetical protein